MLSVSQDYREENIRKSEIEAYLFNVAEKIHAAVIQLNSTVRSGSPSEIARDIVQEKSIDLMIVTTSGSTGEKN